MRIKMQSTEFE